MTSFFTQNISYVNYGFVLCFFNLMFLVDLTSTCRERPFSFLYQHFIPVHVSLLSCYDIQCYFLLLFSQLSFV